MSNDDLLPDLDELVKRYTADQVPPCRVCGGPLSVQSAGGGNATVWGCSMPGGYSSDHYEKSRWTQYRSGDPDVLALVAEVRARRPAPADGVREAPAPAGVKVRGLEYTDDDLSALGTLAHAVLSPPEITSAQAKLLLDIMARMETLIRDLSPAPTQPVREGWQPDAAELASEMWEYLFGETRDNVPDGLTDDLLTRLASGLLSAFTITARDAK